MKLATAATATVLAAGGYFLYSVFAVQGQGTLAQAPLNVQAQVPPAFIMAVDDSGSMTFETLFPGRDGQAYWDNATAGTNGFFDANGNLRTSGDSINAGNDGDTGNGSYNHLLPYPGHRIDSGRFAIPPLDKFGFARSPEFNPAYFNPLVTYSPWKRPNVVTNAIEDYPNASTTATRPDPDSANYTFNLSAIHRDRTDDGDEVPAASEMFVVPDDAFLPEGTQYYMTASCGGLGGRNGADLNKWMTVGSGGVTMTNDCAMGIAYRPATFYLKTTTPAPPGYDAGRVEVANACGNGCNMYRYEITDTMFGTDAPALLQNFANWFSFYGDRNRSMIAGLTRSLVDVEQMRIGMFTINDREDVVMRNMDVATDKAALYNDHLLALPASGSTPNRFAVDHLGKQFQREPEDENDTSAPVQLACQKNVGMLFTDGYSNQGSVDDAGNVDEGMPSPLNDSHSNTLADIAAKYYLANLRDDLPADNVKVPDACKTTPNDPKLDCRNDPHMNFYGITLGAKGNLYGSGIYIDDPITRKVNEATEAAYVTPPAWQAWENDRPSTVDEIWHAAMNGRGEYINATTPADITAAMRRVIAALNEGKSPAGSIAVTGSRIGAGTLTVEPFYEAKSPGTDWYSTLTARTVSVDPVTRAATFTFAWEASAQLPDAASRTNVWFTNSAGTVVPFDATNVSSLDTLCDSATAGMSLCTAAEIAALDTTTPITPITVADAVNYLKGDQSKEADGTLRFRTTRLGDIVNSTPIVSAPTDDYGYRSLPAPYGSSYGTYLTTTKNGRRPMVYAGANDGMLHAFDGRTSTAGGVERFAFIPQSVVGHLGNLLFPYDPLTEGDQKFQHRYYVDGPLAVSDAYYDGAWETVLVGTTGAGARGVFALNVSDASHPSTSFGATDRLWEINDTNVALPANVRQNIGFVLGKPVIVPVKTSTGTVSWKAIFGNGYNSEGGKAVLFMVDIDDTATPTITMIEAVETGDDVPAGSNGLGNIVVVDRWAPNATTNALTVRSRDGFADTVYAADQKGAIWKFDLRSETPANLETPLFTTLKYASGTETGTRQPITGGLTAAAGPGGGVLLYFGTGSFSFAGDGADETQQSLYAVLDNGGTTTLTRADLLQQTIGTTVNGVRTTSMNGMTAGLSGWYLDLTNKERFVAYPRIESGVVFMPTYSPNEAVGCGAIGNNWLYGLNALTGAAALSNARVGSPTGASPGAGTGAMVLETGGTAPVKDVAVMTAPRIAPLGSAATADDLAAALGAQCSMVIQVAGAPPLYLPRACGRQSWRQIQ
ncbi:pilus assembly protein [Luteimonas cucumeris]